MRTAIYALGIACAACGGEARPAATPSTPSQPQPSTQPVSSAEPGPSIVDAVGSDPEIKQLHDAATDSDAPSMPPDFVERIWDEEACRGDQLDLETMRDADTCKARDKPDLPVPAELELEATEVDSVPYGKMMPFKAQLVNHGSKRVGFVVTTGWGAPSVQASKLRFKGTEVEASCSFAELSSAQFYYVELEPAGKLSVEGELYPSESLQGALDGECAPAQLPRGKEYQVQLSVSVNQSTLATDWSFKIK